MRAARTTLSALLLAVLLSGCGDGDVPTYPAGGRVTLPDGTSPAGGWVEFRPVDSPHPVSATGEIRTDGTFRLGTFEPGDGAIEGPHRAIVLPPQTAGDRDAAPNPPPAIDPRYADYATSGLEFTVTRERSKNRFEIHVEPAEQSP